MRSMPPTGRRLVVASAIHGEAVAACRSVDAIGADIRIRRKEFPDGGEFVLRNHAVERLAVDRLGEELDKMAAHVFDHPPLGVNLAAEIPARIAVDVDERLWLDG